MRRQLRSFLVSLSLVLGITCPALAQQPELGTFSTIPSDQAAFTFIDPPNSKATHPRAINSEGEIVGWYVDSSNKTHGFLRSVEGEYSQIDVPVEGARLTQALGINNRGDIVGTYTSSDGKRHGYLLGRDGEFSAFDPLNSVDTVARGINSKRDIVGFFNFFSHGYLLTRHGNEIPIDVPFPGVLATNAQSINARGEIVGPFADAAGAHGFVRSKKGDFTQVDVPFSGGHDTQAFGNNNDGDIVGCWTDSSQTVHAFVKSEDDFMSFDAPSAQFFTIAYGINSQGDVVGEYFSSLDGKVHGFLRTQAEEGE